MNPYLLAALFGNRPWAGPDIDVCLRRRRMRCSLWELRCWRWKLSTAAARSREEDVVEGDGLLVLVKRENDSLKCGNTNNGGGDEGDAVVMQVRAAH